MARADHDHVEIRGSFKCTKVHEVQRAPRCAVARCLRWRAASSIQLCNSAPCTPSTLCTLHLVHLVHLVHPVTFQCRTGRRCAPASPPAFDVPSLPPGRRARAGGPPARTPLTSPGAGAAAAGPRSASLACAHPLDVAGVGDFRPVSLSGSCPSARGRSRARSSAPLPVSSDTATRLVRLNGLAGPTRQEDRTCSTL